MKYFKLLLFGFGIVIMLLQFSLSTALAGDFDWLKSVDIEAKADLSGFKARLETRFRVGDLEVKAVLSTVDKPSDAYMVLRIGELSNTPVDRVLSQYKKSKGKGWGKLARELGIKPGSREFHELKRGYDLDGRDEKGKGGGKKKKKGKSKGKGRR